MYTHMQGQDFQIHRDNTFFGWKTEESIRKNGINADKMHKNVAMHYATAWFNVFYLFIYCLVCVLCIEHATVHLYGWNVSKAK